jgi:hypothetical protein
VEVKNLPSVIAPGISTSAPVHVKSKRVIPGTYPFILRIDARFQNPPGPWEMLTVQSKVTLGVPGASEAMQFLGIPSLLLLPGALIILTYMTLLPFFTGGPEIDWKRPGLLLGAVILSFASAWLYPRATSQFGTSRDYLRGYDLEDIIYLWSSSIGTGALAALTVAGTQWGKNKIKACLAERARKNEEFNNPLTTDGPLEILQKLLRNKKGLRLQRMTNSQGVNRLRLPFGRFGEQWLVQPIVVRPSRGPKASERGKVIQTKLEAVDRNKDALQDLVKEIETGAANGELMLAWADDNTKGPEKDPPGYGDGKQLDALVRYEPT